VILGSDRDFLRLGNVVADNNERSALDPSFLAEMASLGNFDDCVEATFTCLVADTVAVVTPLQLLSLIFFVAAFTTVAVGMSPVGSWDVLPRLDDFTSEYLRLRLWDEDG